MDSPVSIAKAADAVAATRQEPDSSIVRAARAVAAGEADALVAAGSTGTALAAGLFHIRRDPGISRPALALTLPVPGEPVTLLDVGANAEVRPEHLVQFAFMGAAFARVVHGIERPRVGLLSNGEEDTRGTPLVREAHVALAERAKGSSLIDFAGNVEGTQILHGAADVVVTDGFTGNVALKLIESTSQRTIEAIREVAEQSNRGRPRRAAAAQAAARAARGHRSRGGGRRVPARAAAPRHRRPRPLHPRRLRPGDAPGGARRARRRGGAHARGARGVRCPTSQSRRVRRSV